MKTKPLFFFALFLLCLFIFFRIDHVLRDQVLSLGGEIKGWILDFEKKIHQTYRIYFDQAQTIKTLLNDHQELETLKLKNLELQGQLKQLQDFYHMPALNLSFVSPVQILAYVEVGNYNRVWLKEYQHHEKKFYGLVSDGIVAGVATQDQDMRMVGYLNGDSLCSYGVYIGDNKAPGIVRGTDGAIVVDFIPLGSEIKKGDKVKTSGLDQIFFSNIPVGEIVEIKEENGYLSAKVASYLKNTKLNYMWLIEWRNDD